VLVFASVEPCFDAAHRRAGVRPFIGKLGWAGALRFDDTDADEHVARPNALMMI